MLWCSMAWMAATGDSAWPGTGAGGGHYGLDAAGSRLASTWGAVEWRLCGVAQSRWELAVGCQVAQSVPDAGTLWNSRLMENCPSGITAPERLGGDMEFLSVCCSRALENLGLAVIFCPHAVLCAPC